MRGAIMPRKKKTSPEGERPSTPVEENDSMAKDNVADETVSGYWKKVFAEHPRLVHERSNEELFTIYLKDHPDLSEVPKGVKNGLSNVKSTLRKSRKNGRRKRGRPKGDAAAPAAPRPARAPGRGLEALEEQIDECLRAARGLGNDKLDPVIQALRKARNQVVILGGA
jgi:hypothetical protein